MNSHKSKHIKVIAFALLGIISILLSISSVVGKYRGLGYALEYFYCSTWMIVLWAILALLGVLSFILSKNNLLKRPATLAIHLAFILILTGAAITHYSSTSFMLHLREGESINKGIQLTLIDFELVPYPDSDIAMDYISRLRVSEQDGSNPAELSSSMNKPGRYNHWRIFQTSYDPDKKGSTLTLSYDPWGTAVSYIGYALLFLGYLGFFIEKNTRFWQSIRTKEGHNINQNKAFFIASILLLVVLIILFIRRCFLIGGLALNSTGEVLLFASIIALCLGLCLRKHGRYILACAIGLSLFCLITSLCFYDPMQISKPAAILRSPLLGVHVSIIIIAYCLFAFISIVSVIGLISKNSEHRASLCRLSHRSLYPAVFLLATGIFIGAIWANLSWGRYWGWDPKETWALISLLVYSMGLHDLPWTRKDSHFRIFCLLAFLCIIICFLGVNFLFQGFHSYY